VSKTGCLGAKTPNDEDFWYFDFRLCKKPRRVNHLLAPIDTGCQALLSGPEPRFRTEALYYDSTGCLHPYLSKSSPSPNLPQIFPKSSQAAVANDVGHGWPVHKGEFPRRNGLSTPHTTFLTLRPPRAHVRTRSETSGNGLSGPTLRYHHAMYDKLTCQLYTLPTYEQNSKQTTITRSGLFLQSVDKSTWHPDLPSADRNSI
jgi:hypothetical protein